MTNPLSTINQAQGLVTDKVIGDLTQGAGGNLVTETDGKKIEYKITLGEKRIIDADGDGYTNDVAGWGVIDQTVNHTSWLSWLLGPWKTEHFSKPFLYVVRNKDDAVTTTAADFEGKTLASTDGFVKPYQLSYRDYEDSSKPSWDNVSGTDAYDVSLRFGQFAAVNGKPTPQVWGVLSYLQQEPSQAWYRDYQYNTVSKQHLWNL